MVRENHGDNVGVAIKMRDPRMIGDNMITREIDSSDKSGGFECENMERDKVVFDSKRKRLEEKEEVVNEESQDGLNIENVKNEHLNLQMAGLVVQARLGL